MVAEETPGPRCPDSIGTRDRVGVSPLRLAQHDTCGEMLAIDEPGARHPATRILNIESINLNQLGTRNNSIIFLGGGDESIGTRRPFCPLSRFYGGIILDLLT